MIELSGDVPLCVYADWLEDQGEDTALLRLLIESGLPASCYAPKVGVGQGFGYGAGDGQGNGFDAERGWLWYESNGCGYGVDHGNGVHTGSGLGYIN